MTNIKNLGNSQNTESVIITSLIFYLVSAILAGLTILTHISQLLSISFKLYFGMALGVCIVIAAFGFMAFKHWISKICIRDAKTLLLLLGLGLAGSIISLIINSPTIDDFNYVPNAVFYIQNPSALMGFKIHYLFSRTVPFEIFGTATSGAYEYILALISFGLHINFLNVYYFIMPAVAGFLIPLAFFLAIVHFSDDTLSAVIGTLITFGVALLLGETGRTFGNFSFAHAYVGKAILVSIGIPLFIAFSLNYFSKPSHITWVGLFLVSTVLIGMSSSTIFILPALSSVLLLAYMISARQFNLKMIIGYFTSLIYVIAVAFYTFIFWKAALDNGSGGNQGWPTTFLGHAMFFVNPRYPLTPILATGSIILAFLVLTGLQKRFILIWVITTIVLFLNPINSMLLIEYVTSANAYWRMFYIIPFPLIIGIVSATLFTRMGHSYPAKRFSLVLSASIVLFGFVLLSPTSVFNEANTSIGWPTYKLPPQSFKQAKAIIQIAPPGVMLAPIPIGGVVDMLDSRFPQIRVRNDSERTFLPSLDEANLRITASDYIGGVNSDFLSFQSSLNLYENDIRSIVIKEDVVNKNIGLKGFLNAHKFINQKEVDGYVVFWK